MNIHVCLNSYNCYNSGSDVVDTVAALNGYCFECNCFECNGYGFKSSLAECLKAVYTGEEGLVCE